MLVASWSTHPDPMWCSGIHVHLSPAAIITESVIVYRLCMRCVGVHCGRGKGCWPNVGTGHMVESHMCGGV